MLWGMLNYLLSWRPLNIRRGDLVLELGSGNHPFIRSDVLLDKYLVDGSHRPAQLEKRTAVVIDRPLICGDAEALPFVDGAFDYVASFHLLEHLDRPDLCLQECMRVASKGYIVLPHKRYEKMFGWEAHRTMGFVENTKLVIEQKTRFNWRCFEDGYFYTVAETSSEFKRFYRKHLSDFEVRFEWQGHIDYEYRTHPDALPPSMFLTAETTARGGINEENIPAKDRLRRIVRVVISRFMRSYHSPTVPPLSDLLACPVCKVPVTLCGSDDSYLCHSCRRRYPILQGIPMMLAEASS